VTFLVLPQHSRIELSRRRHFDYRAVDALSLVKFGILLGRVRMRLHAAGFGRNA
jgi:hypothetical protein